MKTERGATAPATRPPYHHRELVDYSPDDKRRELEEELRAERLLDEQAARRARMQDYYLGDSDE